MLIRPPAARTPVRKPSNINDLLTGGSARLTSLREKTRARTTVLAHVRAALAPSLAGAVASAGIEGDRLTVGVSGAAWASRLRYATQELRERVGQAMGVEIQRVRIKVVQPGP